MWLLLSAVVDIYIACSMTFLVSYNNHPDPSGWAHRVSKALETSKGEVKPFYNGPAEAYPVIDAGNECCHW